MLKCILSGIDCQEKTRVKREALIFMEWSKLKNGNTLCYRLGCRRSAQAPSLPRGARHRCFLSSDFWEKITPAGCRIRLPPEQHEFDLAGCRCPHIVETPVCGDIASRGSWPDSQLQSRIDNLSFLPFILFQLNVAFNVQIMMDPPEI